MISIETTRPVVSILIPVFNRKEYIAECIESAINQTFTDIEIVIVDNASKDGTWEICQHYAAIDPRIKIFQNESNIGPVRNWMRCANEAKGKFVKVLFSDDYLEQTCLARMLPLIANSTIAFVYCAAKIGISKDKSKIAYANTNNTHLKSKQYIDLVIDGIAPVSPGAILIRTEDFKKNLHLDFPTRLHHFYEKNGAGPDIMIMLLSSKQYDYIAHIAEPLVFFRVHEKSFSIANENDTVTKNYQSVMAWFLKNNSSKINWFKYLSKIWTFNIIFNKKIQNPVNYIKNYEGLGTAVEVLMLFNYSALYLVKKLIGFIFSRIKNDN